MMLPPRKVPAFSSEKVGTLCLKEMIIYDALWRKFDLEQLVENSNETFQLEECDKHDLSIIEVYCEGKGYSCRYLPQRTPEGEVLHQFYLKKPT